MNGFVCGTDRRRRLVLDAARTKVINGIDYLEVDEHDQRRLHVHFLAEHGVAGLRPDNIAIDGGVRVTDVTVVAVEPADAMAMVLLTRPGDFSSYTLRLRTSHTDDTIPAPFDPRLAAVMFSFKADCPNPFDCAPDVTCPPEAVELPDLDYLAKDYASFRQLMLDRMAVTAPSWNERSPADLMVTLVELLAAVADEQSYTQDAVATEAYLHTARLRRSVRRHARLVGYLAHEGCNARTFVQLTADDTAPRDGVTVPAGTPVFTGEAEPAATTQAPPLEAVVFRTLHAVTVRPGHGRLAFHTWGEEECCLPSGATNATLVNRTSTGDPVDLQRGDLLLLSQTADPGTLREEDADPTKRFVVRLASVDAATDPLDGTEILDVGWDPADALPSALCVAVVGPDGQAFAVAAAGAGVAVAEHGRPVHDRALVPDATPGRGLSGLPRPYRPRLTDAPLTFLHDYEATAPASAQLVRDPRTARPDLTVHLGDATWQPTPGPDLLNSGPQDRHVVVETETDGTAWLRFGDGVYGRRPPAGATAVRADHGLGNGTAGNVGRDVLHRVCLPPEVLQIAAVTNPLAATGGVDPEPLEGIRLSAPEAFRVQQRAVTPDDYEAVLRRHRDVQRAHANLRWTGSWYTVFVAVDLLGGRQLDPLTEAALRRHLDRYRMAGHDVELTAPQLVAIDLRLEVCATPGYERRDVEARLLERLSSRRLPTGSMGLFHPDRFTFGDAMHLSEVYAAALGVAGVDSLVATRFQRWGRAPAGELEAEVLRPAEQEIVQLANDPNFPEHGRLEIDVRGGR